MAEFVTNNQWSAIQGDLKGKRPPVTAVVSFIGKDADTLMPLRKGDRLFCNADDLTIKRGLTNPDALKRFHSKGVEVYSVVGLHAKVISGSDFAWVGSANASNSGYIEATVRLGPNAAKRVRSWANELSQQETPLTGPDISRLQRLPRPARSWAARPPRSDLELSAVSSLNLLWLEDWASEKQNHAAEKDHQELVTTLGRSSGVRRWSWFVWSTQEDGLVEGAWIIVISGGRPGRPARIERSSLHRGFRIVWYQEVSTPRIARQSELAKLVPGWWDWDGVLPLRISRKVTTAKVLNLYN